MTVIAAATQGRYQAVVSAMASLGMEPIIIAFAASDPHLIEAVADVDRSQIRDALAATSEARLRTSWGLATSVERVRRANRG